MNVALSIAAEGAETANHLPISPIGFGITAFAVLLGLLIVSFAFKNVGQRH
ncbi:hypothetical protein GCM10010401_19000 [Rarobacter faecitabidus]|uniref:Uncharacterized protein n=1 Tax=Rarobacter faecitabidus TaxID=13243 RepID=A0A542ZVA1_RARFA|nr:hypothetical protein [Rarobacter faecitabidus]TQL64110.1 hypothetical protein FB461_0595 [Rarobacter faecitabidus]